MESQRERRLRLAAEQDRQDDRVRYHLDFDNHCSPEAMGEVLGRELAGQQTLRSAPTRPASRPASGS